MARLCLPVPDLTCDLYRFANSATTTLKRRTKKDDALTVDADTMKVPSSTRFLTLKSQLAQAL